MQDMPTGWYTRRREEKQLRPQQAQPFGQMAVQWLTWESTNNGCAIRHQVNGGEKQIGKLPVDGWCPEARTAYQFHDRVSFTVVLNDTTKMKQTR